MRRWGLRHKGRINWKAPMPGGEVIRLIDAVPGKKYRIESINGGCRLNSHLCAMGFIPYEIFYVSRASRGGPLCIIVKGTKFAIGRGMAGKILIRELENEE